MKTIRWKLLSEVTVRMTALGMAPKTTSKGQLYRVLGAYLIWVEDTHLLSSLFDSFHFKQASA